MKFFAKAGEYAPSGMFSTAHFIILGICLIAICFAVYFSRKLQPKTVRRILGILGIVFIVLEICKILFVTLNYGTLNVNSWVPLYLCSIFEFAAVLSGFCKGKLQKIGDTFLYFGGIVAGLVFLICPSTSIVSYNWFHFLVFHSFLLHSCMVYGGLLLVITKTYKPNIKDVLYYCSLIILFTIGAFIVNKIYGSNLMFISARFGGNKILDFLFDTFGLIPYAIIITLAQTIGLFYSLYFVYWLSTKIKKQ